MKRNILFLLSLSIVLFSCSDKDDPIKEIEKPNVETKDPFITLKKSNIDFTNEGGSESILIESNVTWATKSSASWCTVTPTSGNKSTESITLSAPANKEYDNRSCTVTIESGNITKTITVNQGENLGLLITQDKYELGNEESSIKVEVKANVEFEVEINDKWISKVDTRGLTTSQIEFKIAENETYGNREGSITIKQKGGNMSSTITIFQSQEDAIILSEKDFELTSKAQSVELEIKTNIDYEIIIPEDAKGWVTNATTRALRTETVVLDITENKDHAERTAKVIVKNKKTNLQEVVTIKQAANTGLIINTDKYEVSNDGGTIEVEVKANVEFDIEISDNWITRVETRGLTATKLQFQVAKNQDYDNREGSITIKQKGGNLSSTIKVYQSQKDAIIISEKTFNLSRENQAIEVEVKTNVEFQVIIPEAAKSWVSYTPTRGLRTENLTLNISENKDYNGRSTEVYVKDKKTNLQDTLTINQAANTGLIVSPNKYEVSNDGGTIEVEVKANFEFDIEISDSWISQVKTRGLTATKLQFQVAKNKDYDNREGTIIIKQKGGNLSSTIKVYQSQKDAIILSKKNFELSSEAQSVDVEVKTNVDYEIIIIEDAKGWVTHTTTRALRTETVVLNVAENEEHDTRTVEVYIKNKVTSLQDTLTISQEAKNVSTVTTSTITNVTSESATCGGNVINDGGAAVIVRGVCWSTSENPTILNDKTFDGTGVGVFTSSITELSPGTTYYVRAYATNSVGTGYGNEVTVKASASKPTVITSPINTYEYITATVGGEILSDGGARVTESGVYWGKSINPEKTGTKYNISAGVTEDFSSKLTDLEPNTTYYVNAYAINSQGESYGSVESFTTKEVTIEESVEITDLIADEGGEIIESAISSAYSSGGLVDVDEVVELIRNIEAVETADATPTGSGIVVKQKDGFYVNLSMLTHEDVELSIDDIEKSKDIVADEIKTALLISKNKALLNGNKNALILAPFQHQVETNLNRIDSTFKIAGCTTVDIFKDSEATLDKFRGSFLSNYSIIFIITHGSANLRTRGPIGLWLGQPSTVLCTGEKYNKKKLIELTPEERNAVAVFIPSGEGSNKGHFALSVPWLKLTTNKDFPNSWVFVEACESAKEVDGNASLSKAFLDLNAAGYNGFKENINTFLANNIAEKMASEFTSGLSFSHAYENVLNNEWLKGLENAIKERLVAKGKPGKTIKEVDLELFSLNKKDNSPFYLFFSSPSVFTSTVENVTASGANLGGIVTSDGGATVTDKGVEYSTESTPTTSSKKISSGSGGIGDFTINVSDLNPNTTYYTRAYATNSEGTAYGKFVSFQTQMIEKINTPILNTPANRSIFNKSTTSEVDIRWGSVTGADEYWLNVFPEGKASTPIFDGSVGRATNKTININREENGIYVIQVKARRTGGEWSEFSNSHKFIADTPPAAPTITAPENKVSITRNTSQTFSWDKPSLGIDRYHLRIVKGTNLNATPIYEPNEFKEDSKSVNCNWEPGTYTWSVRAIKETPKGFSKENYETYISWGSYAENRTFVITVPASVPTVTTSTVTSITENTAKSGGNISSDGGLPIIARGICWSTLRNPTVGNNKTTDGTGIGSFLSSLTNLTANTSYYVRAYATNSVGTVYGEEKAFKTQDDGVLTSTFTDSRDGNVYKAVTIGNQVWMAENLKYLPAVVGPATSSYTTPYYYVYGYDGTDVNAAKATANYSTYGALYNWPAAMAGSGSSTASPSGVQGVCPTGWHLPSDAEWTQLTDYLGGTNAAGMKLKETGTAHWDSPNRGATNETGFTALPGGYRNDNGTFYDVGGYGGWWSATEFFATNAWFRVMGFNYSYVFRNYLSKEVGFSVRCVRD